MSPEIVNESIFWLYCFATGIAITVVYDLLRVFRNLIKHPYIAVAIEDIIFWIFVSVILFLLLYYLNNGTVRWFAVFGLFLGMLFYKKIFGDFLVNFMSTILGHILHLVVSVLNVPLKVVKGAFFKGFQWANREMGLFKKKLTGNIKGFRIVLCKRKNRRERDTHEKGEASQ